MEKRLLMDQLAMERALVRISHQIIENHGSLNDIALIGIKRRGVPLAERIADNIASFEGIRPATGVLDITFYRDDLTKKTEAPTLKASDVPFDVTGRRIVMVDDVLFTGRTARAAMDAIMDLGRPKRIGFAVLIDRGHRELPIRADYVGKNIPTASDERIHVSVVEIDGTDAVVLARP